MDLTLKIWRQAGPEAKGEMKTYPISGVEEDMSFLEMLDYLNEQLIDQGIEPVVFDHDCREGICVCVRYLSMVKHTVQAVKSRRVSCTCVNLRVAIPSTSSRSVRRHSQSSKI